MSNRSKLVHSGSAALFLCAFLFSCGVTNADPTPSPSAAAIASAAPTHSPRSLGEMTIQELRDKLKREGAKGNSVNVNVPPVGVYATIDMAPTKKTMAVLQTSTGTAKSNLMHQIESSPGNYTPPVLYALAIVLYQDGYIDDPLFWLTAGQLRCAYDGLRCTDKSAASAFGAFNLEIPRGLFNAEIGRSLGS